MPRIEVVAFGARQWTGSLRRSSIRARQGAIFFREELIPDLERIEEQLFISQGRRGGGSWKALQPDTIRRKVEAGQDPRINIATGMMLDSLTIDKSPYAVREVTNFRLRFGSSAPGAAQSQKNRPIVKITHYDRRRWAQWWAQFIVRFTR